ncbi:site-specific tyrosine recombinase XerC [Stutzerimonas frequens]|jgi:integrase|uniref:tyrosine-type recombinase/integrase n=1 Tax=Stutzerimonas frequens TaxID=2968969 RepID=UPI0012683D5C|nr:tyrosine-type recombinase/integrase [Stutzerimonas frequens]QFU13138.1 site-specific tyrosine recombinase XerC [Stutzerimonas frequens]|tara:strand:+ start:1963 stop:3255 length:1293 start_codon:yes stop_codon:yes gene_type:complete
MADHLILKGGTWHVRLDIPQDVRWHELYRGKRVLTKTLKTGNRQLAKEASHAILGEWQRTFREIRNKKLSPTWKIAAEQIAAEYKDAIIRADTEADRENAKDKRSIGVAQIIRDYWLADDDEALTELGEIAVKFQRPKMAISDTLIENFRTEQTKLVIAKTASAQAANIKKFARYLSTSSLSLDHSSVRSYLDSLTSSKKTKQNILFAGNSFWKFLVKRDPGLKNIPNPFKDHELPATPKGKRKNNSYRPFERNDIEKLYRAAIEQNDTTLAALIKLGAYTGCRIEEICQLTPSRIKKEYIEITDAKTEAGNRQIPIHKNILRLLSELTKQSKDGFLIPSSGKNKYGVRSDPLSKRFGRLKTKLGYDTKYVFHSIRKTTATMLEHTGAPPLVIIAIMGHETKQITFDIYSAGPSLDQKRAAIDKLEFDIN